MPRHFLTLIVSGDGFALTSPTDGVAFDINGDGIVEQLSWVAADGDDAWVGMDRDGNGKIDSGRELFGNFTRQPRAADANGFLALAEYDKADRGGNGDGVVDSSDVAYSALLLWQDRNHNGTSEADELYGLPALGIARIHLDYKMSKQTDEHGNQFRYRAKVGDVKRAKVTRWAWDVILVPAR
jgi:hypothetical protein